MIFPCSLFQDLLSVKDEIIINRIDNARLQKNLYNKKALISLVIIVLTSPSLYMAKDLYMPKHDFISYQEFWKTLNI